MNKDQQIRWMNSITNACTIVSSGGGWDSGVGKKKVEDFANFLYNLSPVGLQEDELVVKINGCTTKEELMAIAQEVSSRKDTGILGTFNEKLISLS